MEQIQQDRLRCLLDRYIDCTSTAEDRQELEKLLLASPEARDCFWKHAHLSVLLREACQIDSGAGLAAVDGASKTAFEDVPPAMETPTTQKSVVVLENLLDSASTPEPFAPQHLPMLGWPLKGLLVVCSFAILAFVFHYFFIASAISHAGSAPWQASTLQLESGSARLALPNIGYVVIDGPAEFDMFEPMRARLTKGRIKVRVTEESGHGFVVETPYGNVTDLGTEFGLDVSDSGEAGLVVFDGAVDLEFSPSPENPDVSQVERLVRGEAVLFGERGQLDRMMSVITGTVETFQQISDAEGPDQGGVIARVSDNRHSADTKKFYEIVRGGLRDDALAYVDRPEHQWNGVNASGLPKYLIGADYVKPFCDDKRLRDFELQITLSRPAKLYVFFDKRVKPPRWLKKDFVKNGDVIGLDVGHWGTDTRHKQGIGPGVSIDDRFNIWERVVPEATTVTLGENSPRTGLSSMYGIAAVPLTPDETVTAEVETQK